MECILCGCNEENACLIRVADQAEDFQRAVAALARRRKTPVPETIGCSWFETDPPVCSAPDCVAKYTEQLIRTLEDGGKVIDLMTALKASTTPRP